MIFGQEGLAHAGIADEHTLVPLLEEVQIEQAQDAVLEIPCGSCGA
jgi:hypothetical protein